MYSVFSMSQTPILLLRKVRGNVHTAAPACVPRAKPATWAVREVSLYSEPRHKDYALSVRSGCVEISEHVNGGTTNHEALRSMLRHSVFRNNERSLSGCRLVYTTELLTTQELHISHDGYVNAAVQWKGLIRRMYIGP